MFRILWDQEAPILWTTYSLHKVIDDDGYPAMTVRSAEQLPRNGPPWQNGIGGPRRPPRAALGRQAMQRSLQAWLAQGGSAVKRRPSRHTSCTKMRTYGLACTVVATTGLGCDRIQPQGLGGGISRPSLRQVRKRSPRKGSALCTKESTLSCAWRGYPRKSCSWAWTWLWPFVVF